MNPLLNNFLHLSISYFGYTVDENINLKELYSFALIIEKCQITLIYINAMNTI